MLLYIDIVAEDTKGMAMDMGVQEAMNSMCKFWQEAYEENSLQEWLECIRGKGWNEAVLGGMHPRDRESMGKMPGHVATNELLAYLNGFDYRSDKGAEWEKCCKAEDASSLTPIPAHAFFGNAASATIILLGINPQFDSVRDINEQRKVMDSILQRGNYKAAPFLPWGQGETGWAWHQSVYAELKEWWKGASPEKLFQLEGFPYATHGAASIPARYRKGEATLPSQAKALELLMSLINDDSCERVFITSGGSLNYWTSLIKASNYDEEQRRKILQRFEDRALLVKNGLVGNPRLTNLCTVKTRKGNKKVSKQAREKQRKAVKRLLRESNLLLE